MTDEILNLHSYIAKTDIATAVDAQIDAALESGNALELRRMGAIMEDTAKRINSDERVRESCVAEIEKYGKNHTINGVKYDIRETGVKYDFSECGDTIYNDLVEILNQYKAKVKEREEYLKRLPREGITQVNEETGEIYRVYPPARSSTTNVAVTIPKQ